MDRVFKYLFKDRSTLRVSYGPNASSTTIIPTTRRKEVEAFSQVLVLFELSKVRLLVLF